MGRTGITLTRYIIETHAGYPATPGEFSALLAQIGRAGKLIAQHLRRAGLINILGATGATNVQGEAVKKRDEIATETFIKVGQDRGLVCALAWEEMEKPLQLPENWPRGKYMLLFDPLDGSSNTDVNMPLGAIFSILRYEGKGGLPSAPELVRKGTEQVAGGYLMYGSSTMLVFTSGRGVNGFTLHPGIGEYLLSHENIRMPARGKVYAVNEGNYHKWPAGTRRYIDHLKESDKARGRPYSSRYSGCLAADVHRLLLGGGVSLHPAHTEQTGRQLRLHDEAVSLALGW